MSAAVAVLLVVAGMIFGALAMGKRSQPASKARKKSSCGKRGTASKIIAIGVLFTDATATYAVLYLCYLSITRDYMGALPYLSALIASLQAATGYVLGHYFKKSAAENAKGGITYDAIFGTSADESDAI